MRRAHWTTDIIKRLNNYNIGRIKEVDLKYFAVVKNVLNYYYQKINFIKIKKYLKLKKVIYKYTTKLIINFLLKRK